MTHPAKKHLEHLPKYFLIVAGFFIIMMAISCFIPDQIVQLIVGSKDSWLTAHLWIYALSIGLFSFISIFLFFFAKIERFTVIYASGLFGALATVLGNKLYASVIELIFILTAILTVLLMFQLIFFYWLIIRSRSNIN